MAADSSAARSLPPEHPVTRRGTVWFVLVGGGGAWTLHLMLAYAIAEFGCLSGLGEKQWGGLTVVAWMLLGVSAVALALAAGATYAAAGIRRRLREVPDAQSEIALMLAFSGRLAFVTNLAFTAIIAVQSVPIFYFLSKC